MCGIVSYVNFFGLDQKKSKNNPKVDSYVNFDLIFGIGLKNGAEITRNYFRSSHGDPFRDQKSFQKSGGKSGE